MEVYIDERERERERERDACRHRTTTNICIHK